MAEDENSTNSQMKKPSPNGSPIENSPLDGPENIMNVNYSPLSKNLLTPEHIISSVAANIADQPLSFSDPDVWGVLTAISEKARKRPQGINMLLSCDEHHIGRLVDDKSFQIIAPAVSACHCKIYRMKVDAKDLKHPSKASVFLKDSSMNGTYLNWKKLQKNSSEAKLCHGDIISVAFAPQHELAFAFVFREVQNSSYVDDDGSLKRKAEEFGAEAKRLKGIGIGAFDGPVSLDDFRSLEKSNKELRKLLENQAVDTESLRNEHRTSIEKHEIEMKELKESVSKSYLSEISELNQSLEVKVKELTELNRISAEQKHDTENLKERLTASMQSCAEANDIIESHKASVLELKNLLDEERDQKRKERDQAAADMKISIQRIQAETAKEIKRLSDVALRREKEQEEMINKLQEAEKERSLLVETLRLKLEDTRQKLVDSDYKVRKLEAQIHEDQLVFASTRKRVEELESEQKRSRKELECEKAAREDAWRKVSALELEISGAMRDLDSERRRLKGARERIMLRETQLRAFYSTTEEISVLFARQQEQLKAMQKTLEDEENYAATSGDAEFNPEDCHINQSFAKDREAYRSNKISKVGSGACLSCGRDQVRSLSYEASVTEKHECNAKTHEGGQDTQEVEFIGVEHNIGGGFGSDINGVFMGPIIARGTMETEQFPDTEGVGTSPGFERDAPETERVIDTENSALRSCKKFDLNKIQMDEETNKEATQRAEKLGPGTTHPSPSTGHLEIYSTVEDTQAGGSIKTADLLASEVAGSWICSTAPSIHEEIDSPRTKDDDEGTEMHVQDSNSLVAESQFIPVSKSDSIERHNQERRARSETIEGCALDDANVLKEAGIHVASDSESSSGDKEISNEMDEDDDDTQADSAV